MVMMSRKNVEQQSQPRTPRWVKAFGIAFIAIVLLVVLLMVSGHAGEHGPGQHLSGGHAAVTLTAGSTR